MIAMTRRAVGASSIALLAGCATQTSHLRLRLRPRPMRNRRSAPGASI